MAPSVWAFSSIVPNIRQVLPACPPSLQSPIASIKSGMVSRRCRLARSRSRKCHCQFHKHLAPEQDRRKNQQTPTALCRFPLSDHLTSPKSKGGVEHNHIHTSVTIDTFGASS